MLKKVCGPIHVSRGVIDTLRAREEQMQPAVRDGHLSTHLDGDRIAFTSTSAEVVRELSDDLSRAITWLEANARVCPVTVSDDLPPMLREYVAQGQSDIFDALAIAIQMKLLLVTDDLPTRKHGVLLGFSQSCWTQLALRTAMHSGMMDAVPYARSMAHLLEAGHNYIGVSGQELAQCLRFDVEDGVAPGKLFARLSDTIGGRDAEPMSHASATAVFLSIACEDNELYLCWRNAGSLLLRKLLRHRHEDHVQILCAVMRGVQFRRHLVEFVILWARNNHVDVARLRDSLINERKPSEAVGTRKRRKRPRQA